MSGAIIPEPLAIPAIKTSPSSVWTLATEPLG